jgi:hypothetical protein
MFWGAGLVSTTTHRLEPLETIFQFASAYNRREKRERLLIAECGLKED